MKHPTIFSAPAPHATFVLEGLSTRQTCSPLVHDTLDIIRVNMGCPVPTFHITERTSQILKPAPIEVIEVSVGPRGVDHARDGIDHYAQVALARQQSLFSLFTILDVCVKSIPVENLPDADAHGDVA